MGWFLGHSVFSGLCCYCVFHLKIPLRDERHYPAGSCWLLRCTPDGYGSIIFRYSWLALFACIGEVVGNILQVDLASLLIEPAAIDGADLTALDEFQGSHPSEFQSLDVPAVVQWQFDNYRDFVHSFVDTIRQGLLMHQYSEWSKIYRIIRGECSDVPGTMLSSKTYNSKILVTLRDADGIVVANGVSEDLGQILGPEHVEVRTVPGGHGSQSSVILRSRSISSNFGA